MAANDFSGISKMFPAGIPDAATTSAAYGFGLAGPAGGTAAEGACGDEAEGTVGATAGAEAGCAGGVAAQDLARVDGASGALTGRGGQTRAPILLQW